MFVHNIDPVLLRVFGLEIRYYGVFFVVAILTALMFTFRKAKERKIKNLDGSALYDLFLIILVSIIIGSRLFNVLFYDLSYYLQNPLQIFAIWRGGLSFHGGLAGALIGGFIFCKRKKINVLEVADIMMIPLALGLFLGRIANFINAELYGIPTLLPWAVKFPGVELARHPTQLYESLKNLFIFFVLLQMDKFRHSKDTKTRETKKSRIISKLKLIIKKPGFILWSFVFLYGTIRFFIEFIKDFPKIFLGLNIGQLLCLVMIVLAVYMFLRTIKK